MLLSLIGGALGMLGGVLGSFLLHDTLHWNLQLSGGAMMIAALFSAAVGIFSGFYPARKASLLDPIGGLLTSSCWPDATFAAIHIPL